MIRTLPRPAFVLILALIVASSRIGAGAGNGRIDGRIVFDDGGPARRAVVTLSGPTLGGGRVTLTDADGQFTFPGLPAGRFTVSARKPPHLPTYYGSRLPGRGPGRPIALADDSSVRLAMTMTRGAVISGRVLDAQGRPQGNALVSVLVARGAAGRLAPHLTVSTNDVGEYRAYGLPAGRYLVAAQAGFGFNGASPTASDDLRWADTEVRRRGGSASGPAASPRPAPSTATYAVTLHPGVVDASQAALVEVRAGHERGAIDVPLQMVPSTRLTGHVVGPDGSVPADVTVGVIWPGHELGLVEKSYLANAPMNLGMSVRNGVFERSAMTPGRYVFVARASSSQPAAGDSAPLDLWARSEITVNGELERELRLVLRHGMSVSGVVTRPPSGTSAVTIALTPVGDGLNLGVPPVTVGDDGAFTFTGVPPGDYSPELGNGESAGLMVASASAGGRDVADGVLTVWDGANVDDVSMVLATRLPSVSGRLTDGLGRPAPDCVIVVFPFDPDLWRVATSRRVRAVHPDTDGAYAVAGLPPGDYLVAAVVSVESGDLVDPDFLRMLAAQASRVTVGPETITLDLQIAGG